MVVIVPARVNLPRQGYYLDKSLNDVLSAVNNAGPLFVSVNFMLINPVFLGETLVDEK